MKPTKGRVIVKPDSIERETKVGSLIVVSEEVKDNFLRGTIVEIANGIKDVRKGDYVIFNKILSGTEISIDKSDCIIISVNDIVAVVE